MTNEVGYTPETNNNEKLPNSVMGTPKRGDHAYGVENQAKPTPLDAKTSAGVIGQPSVGTDYVPVPQKTADVNNSDTNLNITASNENLSAKFKYPRVSQDVPEKGKNQYEDHS